MELELGLEEPVYYFRGLGAEGNRRDRRGKGDGLTKDGRRGAAAQSHAGIERRRERIHRQLCVANDSTQSRSDTDGSARRDRAGQAGVHTNGRDGVVGGVPRSAGGHVLHAAI